MGVGGEGAGEGVLFDEVKDPQVYRNHQSAAGVSGFWGFPFGGVHWSLHGDVRTPGTLEVYK